MVGVGNNVEIINTNFNIKLSTIPILHCIQAKGIHQHRMKNMNSCIQVLATTTFDVCLNVTVCPVLFPFGLHIKVLQSPHRQKWLLINRNWPRYHSDQHGSVHRAVPLSCSTTWHSADCSGYAVMSLQASVYSGVFFIPSKASEPRKDGSNCIV